MRIIRLLKILYVFKRYGLFAILTFTQRTTSVAHLLNLLLCFIPTKYPSYPLEKRLRLALEELGPIFVKFGQLLSTRPDLLPTEYINELAKLQSQVAPFAADISCAIVEQALRQPLQEVFSEFHKEPVASASIAQVHYAKLALTKAPVAVKVLRPQIAAIINHDIELLKIAAAIINKLVKNAKRLRPREIVQEFALTIHDELDFEQEAANNTELARLHQQDYKIIIPKIYYEYSTKEIIVMEWMDGTPIANIAALQAKNIDLVRLSHYGVEIFYTQVFHFGFFHADMHPGNILCSDDGRYIALDFGIVGCLSDADKRYLAINILAFFNRDYKRVALTHVESGWAPKDTPIEQFEHAIRAVCEPIFNKPLAQISFAQVLIKLFQVSRRFGIVVQPQLILLQKTIVNVEGLGRTLNPQLDLWQTAKPILHKWLQEQMGWRGFWHNLQEELPHWSYVLPTLPRSFAVTLIKLQESNTLNHKYLHLAQNYQRTNYFLIAMVFLLIFLLA